MKEISVQEFEKTTNSSEAKWHHHERELAYRSFEDSALPNFRHGLNIVVMPSRFKFEEVKPLGNFDTDTRVIADPRIMVYSGDYMPESFKFEGKEIKTEEFKNFINDKLKDDRVYNFTRTFPNNVTLIKIPDSFASDIPVHISMEFRGSQSVGRLLISAGKHSKCTIVLSKTSGKNSSADTTNTATSNASSKHDPFISEDLFVNCGDGSKIDVVTIGRFSHETVITQFRSGRILKDAELKWIDLSLGSDYNRTHFIDNLDKEGSRAFITALFLGTGKQNYDLYTASHHNAPNTNSDILTRGAVNNTAKALSRGLVRIESNAANSNGYEKQEALILSTTAEADAIPNLEIHNGEVKCSHGSTIGQVDPDSLFYAMSRGLNKDEAVKKIIEGYFDIVVKKLPENIAQEVEKAISEELAI